MIRTVLTSYMKSDEFLHMGTNTGESFIINNI